MNAGLRYDRYQGWLPEQEQLAGIAGGGRPVPVACVAVTAKTFPEDPLLHVESGCAAHRRDLRPHGRRQDGAEGQLRPLLAQPRRRRRQQRQPEHRRPSRRPTLERRSTAIAAGSRAKRAPADDGASLEGAIGVDPNIKAPYTHEASGWIERQLTDTMGIRAGFVYKTEDDLIRDHAAGSSGVGAYTVPFTFTDIGVDGRAGTADDRTSDVLRLPERAGGALPEPAGRDERATSTSRYKTFEVSMNKRYGNKWSGIDGLRLHDADATSRTATRRTRTSRALTTARCGTSRRRLLRRGVGHPHLAGAAPPVGRRTTRAPSTISAPARRCAVHVDQRHGYVEPSNANREDNIWVFDVRAEKSCRFGSRIRLRAYFDVFNMTNSHASETISRATGLSYQKPSAILAPRTAGSASGSSSRGS